MSKKRARVVSAIVLLAVMVFLVALTEFNLSALQDPGHLETRVSNRAKRFLIHRASRHAISARPLHTKTSVEMGSEHYGLDCSICHADDGRGQRPPGNWMYPRAADLTSERVQDYSDEELFWIIKNGIRFTGMPAFAKVETDDHIWDLVSYVRTLPEALRNENSTQ
jgi:cytochrome c553